MVISDWLLQARLYIPVVYQPNQLSQLIKPAGMMLDRKSYLVYYKKV